ncbi:sigma-70 family RNA polymerase sigma factor [Spirosoma sp.]|uniref:RNA polymerase sigma factor n=1 Tax=Spirosoma sp. TaxID=1899569 RepID=UPI0026288D1B|nr:sigma-70 family RNA polymerase sigma factor [Spirosoma sp.]MCX6217364.1 sigma-70 family RNA polymerase sigma factor [Spirosoma sp.]
MKADLLDDTSLWQRFRTGDAVAFDQLVHRYFQQLYRYGVRLDTDDEYVKDCIQDVFVELWQRRNTVNETEFVKFYLLKSLRRRIFRGRAKWGSGWESIQEDYRFEVEFSIESQLINQQSTHDQIRQLEALLNQLSKRQKEVIFLKFYQNLTHEQIAEVMSLNRQSVYNILHEALLRLRNTWQGDMAFFMVILDLFVDCA